MEKASGKGSTFQQQCPASVLSCVVLISTEVSSLKASSLRRHSGKQAKARNVPEVNKTKTYIIRVRGNDGTAGYCIYTLVILRHNGVHTLVHVELIKLTGGRSLSLCDGNRAGLIPHWPRSPELYHDFRKCILVCREMKFFPLVISPAGVAFRSHQKAPRHRSPRA